MDMEHDLNGFGLFFVEYILQNPHDELFGGVIVVMEQDFIQGRTLNLFFGLSDQPMFGLGFPAAHDRPFLLSNPYKSNMPPRRVAILSLAALPDSTSCLRYLKKCYSSEGGDSSRSRLLSACAP